MIRPGFWKRLRSRIIFKKWTLIVASPTRGGGVGKRKPTNVYKCDVASQSILVARKAKFIKKVVTTKPKVPTKG